jgi:glyoxylase-like metal-dependent hydrolase (beta-lactamase superfamily II)
MPSSVTVHPTTVDVELEDGQDVEVGGVRFHALATPGHTPGSTCYLLERDGLRLLFSGDVIMSLAGSRQWKPLGTYAAYLAPRYRGDAAAFLATLRRLRGLPAPQLVLPGHPRMDPVPTSPTMSQQRWEALLDPGIRAMEQLQARYANDGANFLDGTPKKLLPGLYYLGDFQEVAVYGFFASAKFFLVDAPGGPGLNEFLEARLRQLGLKPAAPAAVLLTSGNREETAGLPALVAKWHCQVVASPAAREEIQKACPAGTKVIVADDLPRKGWFPVTPIPLAGRGVGPVAYLLPWAAKSVLFSGRIPIKATQPAWDTLARDFARAQGSVPDYLDALRRLGERRPDVWLPAFPANGQNANLYDSDWETILAQNERIFR